MREQESSPPANPGLPGRNRRADGARTRARIIESVGQLFGAGGFAETTSKAIARHAGVDLASINYHFGSRDGLYKSVLAEAHRRLINLDELHQIASSALAAPDKLRQMIELIVSRAMGPTGWNAHVLARELLSPTSHLDILFEEEMPPKFRIFAGILSEISGIPARDPALIRCAISVGAPCAMLFVAKRTESPLARQIERLPQAAMVEHLLNFALGGLEAVGRGIRASK